VGNNLALRVAKAFADEIDARDGLEHADKCCTSWISPHPTNASHLLTGTDLRAPGRGPAFSALTRLDRRCPETRFETAFGPKVTRRLKSGEG
jgi:hypothetical protein